jgi:uncharacterized protein YegL
MKKKLQQNMPNKTILNQLDKYQENIDEDWKPLVYILTKKKKAKNHVGFYQKKSSYVQGWKFLTSLKILHTS